MAYWQSDLGELGHDFGSRRGAVRFFGYTILLVSVTFLESARVRLRGASKYVKTNTFEQGLILTTLTDEMRFFEFSCTPMGRQARFERDTY